VKRPNPRSQRYNALACSQAGMPLGSYERDLEQYCNWVEGELKEALLEHTCAPVDADGECWLCKRCVAHYGPDWEKL